MSTIASYYACNFEENKIFQDPVLLKVLKEFKSVSSIQKFE